MNQAHIHLLITHLPIFGSFLGLFVLLYGLRSKSEQTKMAAYYIFIICALGAGIAYLTGEGAEETVESIQGISKDIIEHHEDFAAFALISLLILGAASIAGLFMTVKKSTYAKGAAVIILIMSLISFGLTAWTGYLGGQIRHTEIYQSSSSLQDH